MEKALDELLEQINALRDNHAEWSQDDREACADGLQRLGAELLGAVQRFRTLTEDGLTAAREEIARLNRALSRRAEPPNPRMSGEELKMEARRLWVENERLKWYVKTEMAAVMERLRLENANMKKGVAAS